MLKPGVYKTKRGSTMTISGRSGGVNQVYFDWVEEPNSCVECRPEEYDDNGYLVWGCNYCGGGKAKLTKFQG